MNTQEICEELVQRYEGWNYDGDHGVLRYYNEVHKMLMTQESHQTLIVDEDTGILPLLTTVDGTFTYDMESTVWRVSSVLIATDDSYIVDYGSRLRRKDVVVISGMKFYKHPYVRQTSDYVNSSRPAKLVFSQNPGATTTRFYLQQYKRPTEILSVNIQGDIGSPWDMEIAIPATGMLIEGVQSGNYLEAYRAVEKEFKPKMAVVLNSGLQGDYDNEPVPRYF